MAKIIVEENLKSKHPDSFRILKKHGYELIDSEDRDDKAEVYNHAQTNRRVRIHPNGTWTSANLKHPPLNKGKSHSDLKIHLDNIHGSK